PNIIVNAPIAKALCHLIIEDIRANGKFFSEIILKYLNGVDGHKKIFDDSIYTGNMRLLYNCKPHQIVRDKNGTVIGGYYRVNTDRSTYNLTPLTPDMSEEEECDTRMKHLRATSVRTGY